MCFSRNFRNSNFIFKKKLRKLTDGQKWKRCKKRNKALVLLVIFIQFSAQNRCFLIIYFCSGNAVSLFSTIIVKQEMSSRVRKASDALPTKMGPMKATLPMSSLLRGPISSGGTIGTAFFTALSPPMRHISPEHNICGHRSPGALNYKGKLCLFLN